jgi:hypothetical protein
MLDVFFLGDSSYAAHPCSRVSCSTSRWYGILETSARRQGPSSEVEAVDRLAMLELGVDEGALFLQWRV